MGTRALGDRPWLVADDRAQVELATKNELLRSHRDAVLYTTDESAEAAQTLADLIGDVPTGPANPANPADPVIHPVEASARRVQEDLCLLRRRPQGWFLDASCLCFPTRWHLRDKVGQHIAAVHGPVDGYDERIATKVDQLFDRLTNRPVWRRNWFLMTDPTLHQPDRPATETIVSADAIRTDLFIRSERQTLRRLSDEWIVFTIRVQQEPLGRLLTTTDRTDRFTTWVTDVSANFGARRHLSDSQRAELITGLTRGSA